MFFRMGERKDRSEDGACATIGKRSDAPRTPKMEASDASDRFRPPPRKTNRRRMRVSYC